MLTAKQEQFVQNIIQGMSQADAYRSVYATKGMSDKAICREAGLLMESPKVALRFAALSGKADNAKIMSVRERLEWLTEYVKSEDANITAKLKAIEMMNKMESEFSQKEAKTETTINVELVDE